MESRLSARRFDRTVDGEKSLCELRHMDFNRAGAYSYEQAMLVAQRLGLPPSALEQLFRAVFNIMAPNGMTIPPLISSSSTNAG